LAIITISSLFSDRITQIKKGLKIMVIQIKTFFSIRKDLRTIPRSFREQRLFMGVFPLGPQPDNDHHLPFTNPENITNPENKLLGAPAAKKPPSQSPVVFYLFLYQQFYPG